ncbi:MAG: hypothetical protein ACREPY_17635 [Rhodanobacteraceae bacterium]
MTTHPRIQLDIQLNDALEDLVANRRGARQGRRSHRDERRPDYGQIPQQAVKDASLVPAIEEA